MESCKDLNRRVPMRAGSIEIPQDITWHFDADEIVETLPSPNIPDIK